jgi:hypothetical protein
MPLCLEQTPGAENKILHFSIPFSHNKWSWSWGRDKSELIYYVAEFVQGTESCVEEVRGQTPEVFVVV